MNKINNTLDTIVLKNPRTQSFLVEMRVLTDSVISGKISQMAYSDAISRILEKYVHIEMVGEGTNRKVFIDKTDGLDVVFKIPHKLVGYSDNIRSFMVSNYAHKKGLDKYIAKVSLIDGLEPHYVIAQQNIVVLDPSGDWVQSLQASLYSDYHSMIKELDKHFILCDVNLFHTPYNFGHRNGSMVILDLGYLLPKDILDTQQSMAIKCPTCGYPIEYYLPSDNQLEMKKFQELGMDVYTCTNQNCVHSVYSSTRDGMESSTGEYRKISWEAISASTVSNAMSVAARDVFATISQKQFR